MKKKIFCVVSMLLCMVMLFSLCACGGKKTDTPEAKDTLNIAISGDNGTLVPFKITGSFVGIVYQFAEPLVNFTEDGKIDWCLATGIDEVSPNEWIVHVREGVKFNNGNEFDAEDVLFTVETYLNDPQQAMMYSALDLASSEVIDKYTVKLGIANYSAMLMGSISQMIMLDKESYDADKMVMSPIGTGPYEVTDYVVNSHVDLVARDDYWGEKAKIKHLHYKIMNEASQIVSALETGTVDVAPVSAQNREKVDGLGKFNLTTYSAKWSATIDFNMAKGALLADVNARRAICHAIDRDAIVNNVYFGAAEKLDYPVSMHCLDYSDKLKNLDDTYAIGYNPELAKEYAEKAGLIGQTLTIVTNGSSEYVTTAELIQMNLKAIGVEAKIVNYDPASYWGNAHDPTTFDIAVYAASSPQGYAIGLIYEYIMWSPEIKTAWDGLDAYLAQGLAAVANPDPAAREAELLDMSKQFEEQVLWYGLCDVLNCIAASKDLQGLKLWNAGIVHYSDCSWAA